MSGSVDDMPCMNFEANIFAKSLCQHCFRATGAHQHAVQVSSSIPPAGYGYLRASLFYAGTPPAFLETEIPKTKAQPGFPGKENLCGQKVFPGIGVLNLTVPDQNWEPSLAGKCWTLDTRSLIDPGRESRGVAGAKLQGGNWRLAEQRLTLY